MAEEPRLSGSELIFGSGPGKKRTKAATLAAKVNIQGVRSLTQEFSALLKVLRDVRKETEAINKAAGQALGGAQTGVGTPTGAAGTGPAGAMAQAASNVVGTARRAAGSGPPPPTPPGGGGPGGGGGPPVAPVRGPGGFNFASAPAMMAMAGAVGTAALNAVGDRFGRNVAQSIPISATDAYIASQYGGRYAGSEMDRYRAIGQYGGTRESVQSAFGQALGYGLTRANAQAFLPQVGNLVQASGGTMTAQQVMGQVGAFSSPVTSRRAQAMGIMTYKVAGELQNPLEIGQSYIRDFERRGGKPLNEIDLANMQAPGNATRIRFMQLYQLNDDAMETVLQAGRQNIVYRGKTGRPDIDFTKAGDIQRLGLDKNVLGLQAARFATYTGRREARQFESQEGAMVGRLDQEITLQNALAKTEEMFSGLLGPMYEFERYLKLATGALTLFGGAMGLMGMMGMGGGGGGGGGLPGMLGSIFGRGGGGGGGAPGGGVPGAAAPGMGVMGRLGLGAAGVGLGYAGINTINNSTSKSATAMGILETTAAGAAIATAIPIPGVSTAAGAIAGFTVGVGLAAKNYFDAKDSKNVEEGFQDALSMDDKALIDSIRDYREGTQGGGGVTGLFGGAGPKQRGRRDMWAARRGALIAAFLDSAARGGLIKENGKEMSPKYALGIKDLIDFYSSDKVFDDGKWDMERIGLDPELPGILAQPGGKELYRKYFGDVKHPYDYAAVTTDEYKSLVVTDPMTVFGPPTGAAITGSTATETTGDAAFAAEPGLWNTGDAISDKAEGRGETWTRLDSRMKDRLLKLFRASGGRVWLGGGWRSTASQEAMFRDRYRPDPSGSIEWQGQKWKHVKGAAAAPPGRSMHEIGLAADLDGDISWMNAHAAEFGLKDAHDVNNEPWHVQLTEFPWSRREFEKGGGTSDSAGGAGATPAVGTGAGSAMGTALTGGGGGAGSSWGINFSMAAAASALSAGGGLVSSPVAGVGGGTASTGAGAALTLGPAGSGSLQQFMTDVLNMFGAPVTANNLDKLAAIAKQEGNGVDHFNPFNTNTRAPGSVNFNSVGVQKYPDWGTGVGVTARLLSKRPAMGSNLKADAPFADWISAVNNFYASWGGGKIGISQTNAHAFLSHPVTGPGDADFDTGMGRIRGAGSATVKADFNFNITMSGNNVADARKIAEMARPALEMLATEVLVKRGGG